MKQNNFTHVLGGIGMENTSTLTRFVQEGMLERFEALLKALTGSSNNVVILDGCTYNKSGDDYTVSEGSVYYNGEVLSVDSFAGTHATQVPVFKQVISDYTGQNKPIYKDGTFKDTHGVRKMTIVMGATGSGFTDCSAAIVLPNIMPTEWTLLNSTTGVSLISPSGSVSGYKCNWKEVDGDIIMNFRLSLSISGTSSLSILLQLPVPGVLNREEWGSCTVELSTLNQSWPAMMIRDNTHAADKVKIFTSNNGNNGTVLVTGQFRYKKG